jgi:hypothetical protein
MKQLCFSFLVALVLSSCSLTSKTIIPAGQYFELGNNQHGSFRISLKNNADHELTICEAPVNGGRHSPEVLLPDKSIKIKVNKNTALRIENNDKKEATVRLKVTGDTGLSMGYKNN